MENLQNREEELETVTVLRPVISPIAPPVETGREELSRSVAGENPAAAQWDAPSFLERWRESQALQQRRYRSGPCRDRAD